MPRPRCETSCCAAGWKRPSTRERPRHEQRANPKLIGGFVLGAIALVIIGLLAFGSGQYFAPRAAVLYFAGSLAGLDVGPVTFRGQGRHRHQDRHQHDIREQKLRIPVYIDLNPEISDRLRQAQRD
jgi:paraquat-inducible protein B